FLIKNSVRSSDCRVSEAADRVAFSAALHLVFEEVVNFCKNIKVISESITVVCSSEIRSLSDLRRILVIERIEGGEINSKVLFTLICIIVQIPKFKFLSRSTYSS